MTPKPDPVTPWTVDQLVDALNRMRDAWTRAGLELRDIQFELDTVKRQAAVEGTHEIVKKVK
ncbi:MAG: hypothetical protein AUK51_09260 [Comamonadaceae bacterium CG2_30_59_20]|nr:MAG: hypothetical protein AUK51_09260 [Comamonadaceae bacterium CG2_30_59_20]